MRQKYFLPVSHITSMIEKLCKPNYPTYHLIITLGAGSDLHFSLSSSHARALAAGGTSFPKGNAICATKAPRQRCKTLKSINKMWLEIVKVFFFKD